MDRQHTIFTKKGSKHDGEWTEAFFIQLTCGTNVMIPDARGITDDTVNTIRRFGTGPYSFQPYEERMPERACLSRSQLAAQATQVTPDGSDAMVWSMVLVQLPTNFIPETIKTLTKKTELLKDLPHEITALVDCARYFFERADVMVTLVPGNVRSAIQNFQGDDNDADSNVRALFIHRRHYEESLRFIKDLLIFLWLEDPGRLNPYVKWVNSHEFSVEGAYCNGLIASLIYDVTMEVGKLGVATTLMIHAAQSCLSLKDNGRGMKEISAVPHESSSKKIATIVHTSRLCCIAKCLLACNGGVNAQARAANFNACFNIQTLSVNIRRFRSAASLVARPRDVGVNVDGTHIINGLEFPLKDIRQIIPRLLAKFNEIFRKCLSGETVIQSFSFVTHTHTIIPHTHSHAASHFCLIQKILSISPISKMVSMSRTGISTKSPSLTLRVARHN